MSSHDEGNIHPFFVKTNEGENNADNDHTQLDSSNPPFQLDGTPDNAKKVASSKKVVHGGGGNAKTQKTLQEILNPSAAAAESKNGKADDALQVDIEDHGDDADRRKRRRTGDHSLLDFGISTSSAQAFRSDHHICRNSPEVVDPASSPLPVQPQHQIANPDLNERHNLQKTPPKKMLRLTASGRFSSPIKNHTDEHFAESGKRQARPRKDKGPKSLIACLIYNKDLTRQQILGSRIDRILGGEETIVIESVQNSRPIKKSKAGARSSKASHSFFSAKSKVESTTMKYDSPRKISTSTPGKLRMQTSSTKHPSFDTPDSNFAIGSALLKDRLVVKHPGAKEPHWPTREQSHVRGLESGNDVPPTLQLPAVKIRKNKTVRLPFPAEQSILRTFLEELEPEPDSRLRPDGFHDPHPSLQLPTKHLISGDEILRREAGAVSVALDPIVDELPASQVRMHPAIQHLQKLIPQALTAFDEGKGEPLGWTHKHAPQTAATVLQPIREVIVLKNWLSSLTVSAVGGSENLEPKLSRKLDPKPKKQKKKKRKNDDLDDFLVHSDEEMLDVEELTDLEDIQPDYRGFLKSVVRPVKDGSKIANAVLLSGPHGCGKTAAAYAVAKELGFKVFEISACERRGGKDVLDKIGDMTENHMVKHHGETSGDVSSSEEPNHHDEAFMRDLASGRQGTMNSFFKPQTVLKKPQPESLEKKIAQSKTMASVQKAIRKPSKDQQQSLILLEEVDVLFKEDKDFWTTVFKLISTSKRPFIMTCNDEDLVPLQAMSLHAVLRLMPPPVELAVDYMLVMAAAEGHLLRRDAVLSLYESKACDLRASISTLDFWCQMGIGDPRGGLGWIYQRWPPGSDLDEHGRRLRIVSDNTYQTGLGMHCEPGLDEETILLWRCQMLDSSLTDVFQFDAMDASAWLDESIGKVSDSQRLDALVNFSKFSEEISSMDVFSGGALTRASFDATQPELPEKARKNYIEGMRLLQSDEHTDYSRITLKLAVASMNSAYNVFGLNRLKNDTQVTKSCKSTLKRRDFACFDAIAEPVDSVLTSTGPGNTQSAFDGPFKVVTTELAPYVRAIAHFDLALEAQRGILSDIMDTVDGSQKSKRARTTRAARSALEGSQRADTRRNRWFTKTLNLGCVLSTGGTDWPRATFIESREPSVAGEEECSSTAGKLQHVPE
ncbi:ATPase family associated with various cellular activities (AAA) [Acrodontium crateriforme]|uniref:ATPase family associated with various cellular activities (AAA) n=1 Tax=Acrodontium crateriforme TaxID=150365 RepID=A0AAQ3M6X0_9PEZI|nr:ATPase family associated with various cellular activities (AAA) [Acrodontium crateriforme]